MSVAQPTGTVENVYSFMYDSAYLQRVVAGSFGGCCVAFLVTPFDVIKARLQAQNQTILDPKAMRLNGMLDSFVKIGRQEGLSSFWRGLRPTLMMQMPASAMYFPIYEVVKERVNSMEPTQFWVAPVVAGLIARTITQTVVSPLELVRTNLQANVVADSSIESNSKSSRENGVIEENNNGFGTYFWWEGMRRTFVNIIRKHGWKQLWGGLAPTLLRDAPFSAVYWSGFEYVKIKVKDHSGDGGKSFSKLQKLSLDFGAGAISGFVASVISNPVDVIKTRRQMSLSPSGSGTQSIAHICKSIITTEGYSGFLKGMIPRTAKVAPGCAIMISSYEFCKQVLLKSDIPEI